MLVGFATLSRLLLGMLQPSSTLVCTALVTMLMYSLILPSPVYIPCSLYTLHILLNSLGSSLCISVRSVRRAPLVTDLLQYQ